MTIVLFSSKKSILGIFTLKSSLQEALICLYGTDVAGKIYESINIHPYGNFEEVIHREYQLIFVQWWFKKTQLKPQKNINFELGKIE